MGIIDTIDVHSPLLGLNRQYGFQQSPGPYHSADCLNIRSQDVFLQRLRSGSRPGLVQVLPPKSFEVGNPPSGDPVQAPDIFATKDSYITGHSTLDDLNYGTTSSLIIANNSGANNPLRILMHFDLSAASAVPAGATIVTATLHYYVPGGILGSGWPAKIYRIVQTGWVETQVTWNQYATATAWGTAGCASDGVDYSSTTPTPVDWNLQTVGDGGWKSISSALFVAFVQDAVTNRARQLHMLFRANPDDFATIGMQYMFIRSKDYSDLSYRPKLVITYTT